MIELENATTRTPLVPDNADTVNTDLTKQCGEIVDRLLTKDLEYNEEDIENVGKDEQEFEEDIANMDTTPLELENWQIHMKIPLNRRPHQTLKIPLYWLCQKS